MQMLGDQSWVISASDLHQLAACRWLVARTADQKLGKGVVVPEVSDPMMELVARLGLEHEARTLELLQQKLPQVAEISYDRSVSGGDATAWRANISAAQSETLLAIDKGVDAIFQAVFFQERLVEAPYPIGFQGFADFLVNTGNTWEVWDTKLARSAKDTALIQLASYVDQLHHLGIPASPEIQLILGDGTHSIHQVLPLLPAYLSQRATLIELIGERISDPEATPWGDPRYPACGTKGCPACSEQIVLHDDLFQTAGMRKSQRDKIMVAGFTTLQEFAQASRDEVRQRTSGISRDTLAQLHLQASLQVATRENPKGRPAWEVLSRGILRRIPPPSAGDIFFDFEGDPTHQEFDQNGQPRGGEAIGDQSVWFGIEYLFGLWGENLGEEGSSEKFLPLWAESFQEKETILTKFCELVQLRLAHYPDMHIYHYASYEKTRLKVLATRYPQHRDCVELIIDTLLVDLYPVVMKGVRVGLPSYSLKALEALYFSPDTRSGIAGGGESVVAFIDYLTAHKIGDHSTADAIRASILDYNRIDCFSTQALRDWLLTARDQAQD